jgi:hypothetical protein
VIRTEDYKFSMRIRPQKGNAVTAATAGKDIDWALNAALKDIEPTLFDLRADPGEIRNVAYDPHYRPVLDALRSKLQNIILGDSRVEIAWNKKAGEARPKPEISNFAPNTDDGLLEVPAPLTKSDDNAATRLELR